MCGGSDPIQAISNTLADVDPGKAIGQGLAEVDTTVNRELPGGWISPALVAAAVAAPYAAPYLAEAATVGDLGSTAAGADVFGGLAGTGGAFEGLTAAEQAAQIAASQAAAGTAAGTTAEIISSEAGKEAFFNALANGASSTEAMQTGLAVDAVSTGAPVYDFSQQVTLTPGGNTIALGSTAEEMAALDASQKLAGAEALAKASSISPMQALQGLRAAGGLLGNQQPQMMQSGGQRQQMPGGAVDYSGLYNLLSLQRPVRSNPNSLLG